MIAEQVPLIGQAVPDAWLERWRELERDAGKHTARVDLVSVEHVAAGETWVVVIVDGGRPLWSIARGQRGMRGAAESAWRNVQRRRRRA